MVWASTPALRSIRYPGAEAETRTAVPSVSVVPGPPRLGTFKGGDACGFPVPTTRLWSLPSGRMLTPPAAVRCRTN